MTNARLIGLMIIVFTVVHVASAQGTASVAGETITVQGDSAIVQITLLQSRQVNW